MFKVRLVAAVILFCVFSLNAQTPYFVKDMTTGSGTAGSFP